MNMIDEIVYSEDKQDLIKVMEAHALQGFVLRVRFSNGEIKDIDCKPYLEGSAFAPLKDEEVFKSVCVNRGIPMWCDGTIDIAPERLYEDGTSVTDIA